MSLREEFLNYLSSKGIQFSPCVFKDEKAIPPREDWDGFVETLNNFFNKNKEVQDKLDEIMEKVNTLISECDFPLSVLQDVNKRLNDCTDVSYAKQQLRYLQNVKKSVEAQDEEV